MWHQTYHFLNVLFQMWWNKSDFLHVGQGFIQAEKWILQIESVISHFPFSGSFFDCLESQTLILNVILLHPGPMYTYHPLPCSLARGRCKSCPNTSVQEVGLFPCHFQRSSLPDHEWFRFLPFSQCHSLITYSYIQKLTLPAYFPREICRVWASQK